MTTIDTQFDVARNDVYAKMEAIRLEMATCAREFVSATADFITDWYAPEVSRILAENPGRFAELPESRRSDMKNEVLDLVEDSRAVAQEYLGSPELWWHQKNATSARGHNDYTPGHNNTLPLAIDEALRFALGGLLEIMEEYGFNAAGFARRSLASNPDGPRVPSFRGTYRPTSRMLDHLTQYSDLHRTATEAERSLQQIDRNEAKALDQVLWDEA